MAKGKGGIGRYLFCITIHRIILILLHIGLVYFGYTVIELGDEMKHRLGTMADMIGDVSANAISLKVVGIVTMVGPLIFGIPALLTGRRPLLKLHMFVLVLLAAFMALFICVLYAGAESDTISKANKRYADAFKKAKKQDEDAINLVLNVEKRLKCCGKNGPSDYPYGVMDSCCKATPPCPEEDIYQDGCTNALELLLSRTLKHLVKVLSLAIFAILALIIYLIFFCILLQNRERSRKRQAMEKEAEELAAADDASRRGQQQV